LGQTFGNGCFPHSCLTDQYRVVFAPSSQDLQATANFFVPTDNWILFGRRVFGQFG